MKSKNSRLLRTAFSVEVPCAMGARLILSSSDTTEYTADCPSETPSTSSTSVISRRRDFTPQP